MKIKWEVLYWNIAGAMVWISICLLAFFYAKASIWDALTIPSVILTCAYFFGYLVKWGLMDRTIVGFRNKMMASEAKNEKRKKDDLDSIEKIDRHQFRKNMEKSSNLPLAIGIATYGALSLIFIIITYSI